MKTLLLTILFISSWTAITAQNPTLTIESTIVSESAGSTRACVSYDGGLPSTETTVTLLSIDSSAVSTPPEIADYNAVMSTLTFSPSTTDRKCVNITIYSDSFYENFEIFMVTATIDAMPINGAPVTVIIQNDGLITVGFSNTLYRFDEDQGGRVCVSITDGQIQGITISIMLTLNVTDGTATEADDDYNRNSFVPILLGENTAGIGECISAGIIPDNVLESDESFTLQILAPDSNANINPLFGQTQVVITNDDAACPDPPDLMDGSFTFSSPESSGTSARGDTATYSCSLGYILEGPDTLTCQIGNVWSPEVPGSCRLLDCGALPAPDNGAVDFRSTILFSVTTYSCNDGYMLMGAGNRTCQRNETWSNSPPTCEPRDCGSLTPPDNGTVEHVTTTLSSEASYSCSNGFILEGDGTRTCQADGSWSSSEPTCRPAAECPNLGNINNGQVSSPSTLENSVATYSCNNGFILEGDSTRTCQAGTSWSGSEPTCRPAAECPNLDNIDNGQVSSPSNLENSVATYTCNTDYSLLTDSTRMCQSDGTWSGSTPICTLITVEGQLTEQQKRDIGIGIGVGLAVLIIIILVVVIIALTAWCIVKKRGSAKYVLNYSTVYGNQPPKSELLTRPAETGEPEETEATA